MIISRPSGADFDPVSATVYGPCRALTAGGEPIPGKPVVILSGTRIKTPRGLFTAEQTNQGHANSRTDSWIDIRVEGGGDRLTADMWIIHREKRYDIKGPLGVDWRTGYARYQVTVINDYKHIQAGGCE